ncbi:hypothetical protein GUH47_13765, partial [Xanthomonas citri pv. citri]|nr:hypothetical protein [Xanthomonas citri pv. citri]
ASAPVAKPKRAPIDDGICWSSKEIQRRQKEEDDARAAYYHSRASAPVAGEAQPVTWEDVRTSLAEALQDWHGKGDGITTTIPEELV